MATAKKTGRKKGRTLEESCTCKKSRTSNESSCKEGSSKEDCTC